MRHLLLGKGLDGLINGCEKLAKGTNAQARIEHKEGVQKALTSIVMAVGTSQLYLITYMENQKDAWKALRNHFE